MKCVGCIGSGMSGTDHGVLNGACGGRNGVETSLGGDRSTVGTALRNCGNGLGIIRGVTGSNKLGSCRSCLGLPIRSADDRTTEAGTVVRSFVSVLGGPTTFRRGAAASGFRGIGRTGRACTRVINTGGAAITPDSFFARLS